MDSPLVIIQVIPMVTIAFIVSFLMADQKEMKWLALHLSIQAALKSGNAVRVDKHAAEVHSTVQPCLLTAWRGTFLPVSAVFLQNYLRTAILGWFMLCNISFQTNPSFFHVSPDHPSSTTWRKTGQEWLKIQFCSLAPHLFLLFSPSFPSISFVSHFCSSSFFV